ncbi:MAG: glycolate oxidase subunit GlcE [Gammaproteobacteria bacterium]
MATSSNDTRQALAQQLSEQVQAAAAERTPLSIQGGASKSFYGRRDASNHPVLTLADYQGVISFEPTELTVTAAAGTPLVALEQTLAESNQQLPFEPPHFGPDATLGGTIACGLSGPARPYTGSARDFVLGMKIINGRGEILNFGGQVMKNVAGYDVSRLLTGSLGTLGVILEVSLKVLPRPAQELTLTQSCDEAEAIDRFSRWAGKPYPISAAAYFDGTLYLRLAGAASAVTAAQASIGGDILADGATFWQALREQELAFSTPGWLPDRVYGDCLFPRQQRLCACPAQPCWTGAVRNAGCLPNCQRKPCSPLPSRWVGRPSYFEAVTALTRYFSPCQLLSCNYTVI